MRKIENEALAEFSEALKLEPRNVNILLGRAACYMLTRHSGLGITSRHPRTVSRPEVPDFPALIVFVGC